MRAILPYMLQLSRVEKDALIAAYRAKQSCQQQRQWPRACAHTRPCVHDSLLNASSSRAQINLVLRLKEMRLLDVDATPDGDGNKDYYVKDLTPLGERLAQGLVSP